MNLAESKKQLYGIVKKTALILFILALTSFFYESKKISLGIVFGGVVSILNLLAIGRMVEVVLQEGRQKKGMSNIAFILLITVLFGIVYLIAAHDIVNLIAFAVGFSTFILGALIEILFPSQKADGL